MRKTILIGLALLMLIPAHGALAGKKKKLKPWKSEEVTIAVAHPIFYGNTGQVNSITAQEFQAACAIPNSQGLDAWVFEVPAAYQKVNAIVEAIGSSAGAAGYDLDLIFYDADCAVTTTSQAAGTDELGFMGAGTAWILMHNYLGDPETSAHIELKPAS